MTSGGASRILYIDPFLPLHDRNSGSLRLQHFLKLLVADGHQVTLMPHTVMADHGRYATDASALGVELLLPPTGTHDSQSVADALTGRQFDTVIVSFYSLAATYMAHVRAHCPSARVLIDTIDLHFVRERRQAALASDAQLAVKAEQTHTAEIAAYRSADGLIAISSVEQSILRAEVPEKPVFIVPNVHAVTSSGPSYAERSGLVFVGNFWHPPNGEGIYWFCNEVLPRVKQQLPKITLDIVGQDPPADLDRFVSGTVRLRGWVPELAQVLSAARLSIAPLLHGAGLKGKVGEALAAGLPVISTSVGAEGLGLRNGENAMIADTAEGFADSIVQAYSSAPLWERLATNGRAVIEASYTPDAVRDAVRTVFPLAVAVAPVAASTLYFGVPDWADTSALSTTVDNYIRQHMSDAKATLHLGVTGIDIDQAFAVLSKCIADLGFDINTIPDVTLTPLANLDFSFLPPHTIWLPLRADIPNPFATTSATSSHAASRPSTL